MTAPSTEASRAAAGTVALGGLQTAGRGLAVVFVVIATREIVPDQFGRYSIVAGLVVFAGFVADFGSTTVITRFVSRDPEISDRLLSHTIVASVIVGSLAYAVIFLYVCVGPYGSSLRLDVLIGGLAVPIDAALTSILAALDGHGLISRRALVSFLRLAVVATVGIVGVLSTDNIRWAIAGIAIGPLVALAVASRFARRNGVWRTGIRPDWRRSVWLFRTALPYAILGGIGAVVARLDLLVLSWLASPATVANYDLSLRGVEAATTLGAVIGGPALFIVSKRLGAADIEGARRAYSHAARVAYLIGLPVTTVLVALHEPLTRIAFGPRYTGTGPVLAVLALSIWLAVLCGAQGAVILAAGATGPALRASVVILLAAAVADVILIPAFGAIGAAAATSAVAVVSCFMFDRVNRRVLGMGTPAPGAATVLACAASGLAMYGATQVGPVWLGLLFIPVIPLLLWSTGSVTISEVKSLRRLVADGNRA